MTTTSPAPGSDGAHPHAGQSRRVTYVLPVDPDAAYLLVSDVVANAEHSAETLSLRWQQRADPDRITVGDRFVAHNGLGGVEWTTTSVVTAATPGSRFAFAVSGTEHPTATWTFSLEPAADGGTSVGYEVVLGDGPSMFEAFAGADLTRRQAAVTYRLDHLADSMRELLRILAAAGRPSGARSDPSAPADR